MKTKRLYIYLVLFLIGPNFSFPQDTTALEGWQIRPDYAFLGTGQSIQLRVTSCIAIIGGEEKAGFLYDCDDIEGSVPLIPDSAIKDWSVNGVVGGNAHYGTIKKLSFDRAVYTAPSKKPESKTIQVSAVILLEGKTLLVSTITILDRAKVYYGKVQVSGNLGDLSYIASGSLVLKETEANSDNFNALAGSLQVQIIGDCGTQTGTVPLSGDMTLYPDGHKIDRYKQNDPVFYEDNVKNDMGKVPGEMTKAQYDQALREAIANYNKVIGNETGPGIYGDTYYLSFLPDPFEVECGNGIKVPIDMTAWFMPCDQSTVQSDPEFKTLWGEGTCGNSKVYWSLVQQ